MRSVSPETTGAFLGNLRSPRKVVACVCIKSHLKTEICYQKWPDKIRTSLLPTLASVVLLEQLRSLSGEFSNRWTNDRDRGYQESELAFSYLRLEKSDSMPPAVKFRHYCEMEFESSIVGCHYRWFRVEECISGEFISLHLKRAFCLFCCLQSVEYLERKSR